MPRAMTLGLGLALLVGAGCASAGTVDPDKPKHYDERYGHTDLKYIVETMVDSMTASGPLRRAEAPPIVAVLFVRNETSEHINTRSLMDKLETHLLKSGKARLVNREARSAIEEEMAYQASGKVDSAQVKAMGRKLGADLVVTGRFHSIEKKEMKQVRLRKGTMIYYQLALELTDLSTDEILWKDEAEVVKEAKRPLVGW